VATAAASSLFRSPTLPRRIHDATNTRPIGGFWFRSPCRAHDFGLCCNAASAAAMKSRLSEPGVETLLVVWEHWNIEMLTCALGVPPPLVPIGWVDGESSASELSLVWARA